MADYKYQLNMFLGQQSFILRTNSVKEMIGFTGIKKLNSEKVLEYLYKLNDMNLMPGETQDKPIGVIAKDNKPLTRKAPLMPSSDGTMSLFDVSSTVDYETKIKADLHALGGTNTKKALAIFQRLTGLKIKKLPTKEDFNTGELQRMYGMLLKGKHGNGKK